ncbi:hypothetical protein NLU13_0057 [Sarocladium strictum]|uniref:Uncharacterized protein n=1 Tax=Sarocladium strictum TaxID=5046 RepID=A0AA39GPU3_SARSR|nr:hypothetical protein NLU13_0057 [Sarocladium strictum]
MAFNAGFGSPAAQDGRLRRGPGGQNLVLPPQQGHMQAVPYVPPAPSFMGGMNDTPAFHHANPQQNFGPNMVGPGAAHFNHAAPGNPFNNTFHNGGGQSMVGYGTNTAPRPSPTGAVNYPWNNGYDQYMAGPGPLVNNGTMSGYPTNDPWNNNAFAGQPQLSSMPPGTMAPENVFPPQPFHNGFPPPTAQHTIHNPLPTLNQGHMNGPPPQMAFGNSFHASYGPHVSQSFPNASPMARVSTSSTDNSSPTLPLWPAKSPDAEWRENTGVPGPFYDSRGPVPSLKPPEYFPGSAAAFGNDGAQWRVFPVPDASSGVEDKSEVVVGTFPLSPHLVPNGMVFPWSDEKPRHPMFELRALGIIHVPATPPPSPPSPAKDLNPRSHGPQYFTYCGQELSERLWDHIQTDMGIANPEIKAFLLRRQETDAIRAGQSCKPQSIAQFSNHLPDSRKRPFCPEEGSGQAALGFAPPPAMMSEQPSLPVGPSVVPQEGVVQAELPEGRPGDPMELSRRLAEEGRSQKRRKLSSVLPEQPKDGQLPSARGASSQRDAPITLSSPIAPAEPAAVQPDFSSESDPSLFGSLFDEPFEPSVVDSGFIDDGRQSPLDSLFGEPHGTFFTGETVPQPEHGDRSDSSSLDDMLAPIKDWLDQHKAKAYDAGLGSRVTDAQGEVAEGSISLSQEIIDIDADNAILGNQGPSPSTVTATPFESKETLESLADMSISLAPPDFTCSFEDLLATEEDWDEFFAPLKA